MYTLNALLLSQLFWNKPDDSPGTPGTSETPTPANGTGADTTPGTDGANPGSETPGDLLADGTPKPEAPKDGDDLLSPGDPKVESFTDTPVEVDAFKALFDKEGETPIEWNDEHLGEFLDLVNGSMSRQDLAQKALEFHDKLATEAAEEATAYFTETVKEWQKEFMTHPTLGGDKAAETLATVKDFITRFSPNPADALATFKATGVSNSVHLIALLHNAASQMPKEARPAEGAPAPTGKTTADRLFGG